MHNNVQPYDVVIIGAGIAGTVLSNLLIKSDINTLLIGKTVEPLVKLGESLPPSAMPMFERLNLSDFLTAHQPSYGYQKVWGSRQISQAGFVSPQQLGTKTGSCGWKIDKTLLIRQVQASLPEAVILPRNVKKVDVTSSGHVIHLDNKLLPIRASILVDASGRGGCLSRQLQIRPHQFDHLLSYTVNVPRLINHNINMPVFIEAFEQGWGLVSKLSESHNVLSIFTNKNSGAIQHCKKLANWRHLCEHTEHFKYFIPENCDAPVHGMNASSRIAAKLNADNWLLIGDAAMSFDPLSSHGITTAIYTAELAATAIHQKLTNNEDSLYSYAQKLTSIYNTYLNELVNLYRLESRWSNSGFWQSKQNLLVADEPAVVY